MNAIHFNSHNLSNFEILDQSLSVIAFYEDIFDDSVKNSWDLSLHAISISNPLKGLLSG